MSILELTISAPVFKELETIDEKKGHSLSLENLGCGVSHSHKHLNATYKRTEDCRKRLESQGRAEI